jgi:hypothetical protein
MKFSSVSCPYCLPPAFHHRGKFQLPDQPVEFFRHRLPHRGHVQRAAHNHLVCARLMRRRAPLVEIEHIRLAHRRHCFGDLPEDQIGRRAAENGAAQQHRSRTSVHRLASLIVKRLEQRRLGFDWKHCHDALSFGEVRVRPGKQHQPDRALHIQTP